MSTNGIVRLIHVNLLLLCVLGSPGAASAQAGSSRTERTIDARAWRIVERDSGPDNYYRVMREGARTFVRAEYVPPMKSALLGWQVPDGDRRKLRKVRWSWRARTLPRAADECTSGKGDSAAVVYLTWKRGLRYYALKYVWSASVAKQTVCARKRNLFVAQDTIVLESGPPLNTWRSVELDLDHEFRKYFEAGDASANVPDFVGIGIMSDGDQTKSRSSADFGAFKLEG
jgi:DUF3047 family protein